LRALKHATAAPHPDPPPRAPAPRARAAAAAPRAHGAASASAAGNPTLNLTGLLARALNQTGRQACAALDTQLLQARSNLTVAAGDVWSESRTARLRPRRAARARRFRGCLVDLNLPAS
jgi:hypothetical protein